MTCKWLGSPPFISHLPFGSGTTPVKGTCYHLLSIVANELLSRMILQVDLIFFLRCFLES